MPSKKKARVDRALFASALSSWITEHHLSQREAAERLGVSQPQISSWVNAEKTPSPASATRVLPILGVKPDDVAPQPEGEGIAPDLSDRVVMIPREGAVGAAGWLLPQRDGEHDADPYPAEELRRMLGFDPSVLVTAVVVGDSVKDLVAPGTRVMYLPTPEISDHGLYVLDLDGARLIKLVQRYAGGVLALIPANEAYKTETFTPMKGADTPNTYRSDRSTLTAVLSVVGKVVYYPTLA